jgi:hypothetical protein
MSHASPLPLPRPGIAEIAWVPATCLDRDDAVQSAMQQSHDALIAKSGRTRRSPVWWWRYHGRADANRALDHLYPPDRGSSADQDAVLQQLRSQLDHYPDRVLVVAVCEVSPHKGSSR